MITRFTDVMATPEAPTAWLIEPLIVHGDRILVYGQWASFKSFLLSSLTLHLAAGVDFGPFKIAGKTPVLYLDSEMGARRFWRRIRMLAKAMGLESADLPISHGECDFRFGEHGKEKLGAMVAELPRNGVIVVESLRGFIVGSENDQSDLSKFWDVVDPLTKRLGHTVFVSHHMRKPKADSGGSYAHEASGSNLQMTGTDCAFSVVRDPKVPRAAVVKQEKNREAEEYRPFVVAFTFAEAEVAVQVVDDGTPSLHLSPHQMTLWRYVATHAGTTREQARKDCKIKEATMTDCVRALEAKCLIAAQNGGLYPLQSPPAL